MWAGCYRFRETKLGGFVLFEEASGFFEVQDVSIHGQLIFPGVLGDGDYVFNTMAALANGLNEKIDVYHASQCTGSFWLEAMNLERCDWWHQRRMSWMSWTGFRAG